MKIFLDSSNREMIKRYRVILDGITTNPSNLAVEKKNPTAHIKELCSLIPGKEMSVEVTEQKPQDVYRQAHQIASLSTSILVKIPCHFEYYEIIQRLVHEKIKLNITLVFTLEQALFMCKFGVHYISPFVGRLDDNGCDGISLLYEIRRMIDHYKFNTKLLAASLRTTQHVQAAINAGADAVTVPADVLQKLITNALTSEGMKKFKSDWDTLMVIQFPE